MASNDYSCDVVQGFNFQKDAQTLVGHINSLTIGEKEMAVDLAVTNPEDLAGDKVKVVGVASALSWEGGYAEPIFFSCQVSNANKKELVILAHSDLSNTSIKFQFTIYDYDPDEKQYYKAFHSNETDMEGLVLKSGGDLSIRIDGDQSMEVVSPKNFTLDLGVMPEDKEQEIHFAVSVSDKLVKRWGVTVEA